jgi:hypothetical protein
MFRFIIVLLTSFCLISCLKNRAAAAKPDIGYMYILEENTITDSILIYKDLPFERSLALYKDTDSITKFASPEYIPSIYLSVFQVERQRFAVLSDSVATTFYKFSPSGTYSRLCSLEASVGIKVTLQKMDLNSDGYKDVFFTMDTGGMYGDDNVILFYDPKSKSLACNSVGLLQNAEVKGNRVETGGGFWVKLML